MINFYLVWFYKSKNMSISIILNDVMQFWFIFLGADLDIFPFKPPRRFRLNPEGVLFEEKAYQRKLAFDMGRIRGA